MRVEDETYRNSLIGLWIVIRCTAAVFVAETKGENATFGFNDAGTTLNGLWRAKDHAMVVVAQWWIKIKSKFGRNLPRRQNDRRKFFCLVNFKSQKFSCSEIILQLLSGRCKIMLLEGF